MDPAKQKKLQLAGWSVGSAEDFLELSPEEAAYVDFKLALSRGLKHCRSSKKMTQTNLANKIGSSQSRIAKAEAGDPSVSIDLLVKAIFATGATPSDLARLISNNSPCRFWG